MIPSRAHRWSISIVAVIGVLSVYGGTLGFDLFWDDYALLRPRGVGELQDVWTGPWDPRGALPLFYRPLAAWYFSGTWTLFGLNPVAHHLVSVAGVIACAWMFGAVVGRETQSTVAGAFGALLYAWHPAVVVAVGGWVTNQMHVIATLCALAAVALWQRRRDHLDGLASVPIWGLVLAGALVKEDTLFVLPALATLHLWYGHRSDSRTAPRWSFVGGALCCVAAFAGWRWIALDGIGGYGLPSAGAALVNVLKGPVQVAALLPGHGGTSYLTTAVSLSFLTITLVAVARSRLRAATTLAVAGGAILVWTDLPLMTLSGGTRHHLVTLGLLLGATAGAWSLGRSAGRWQRAVLGVGTAAFMVVMFTDARAIQARYRACTSEHVEQQAEVAMMSGVPDTVRTWVARQREQCASGTARPLLESVDVVMWGTAAAAPGGVVALVSRRRIGATFRVRDRSATPQSPVRLVVIADGWPPRTIALRSPDWQDVAVTFAPTWRSRLRGMYRLDVRVDGESSASLEVRQVPPVE